MKDKKYELSNEYVKLKGKTLYRIKAIKDFGILKKGTYGGFVESEFNLSHNGECWIYDDAMVYDKARIINDARIFEKSRIYGQSLVGDNAWIYGNAKICGTAWISGSTRVFGNTCVKDWIFCSRFQFFSDESIELWKNLEKTFILRNELLK